jgi:hypothetical protein
MTARRVWIVGAGKRVLETAIPAIASVPRQFEIAGVFARRVRTVDAAGHRFLVRSLDDLRPDELAQEDLVYVAVGKESVPEVLRRLETLDRASLELLIDTPVLRLKHLRHRRLLDGWGRAGVAEDTAFLPWYEPVRAAVGQVRRIVFDRSAYAYHGLAQAKAIAGSKRVAHAKRARGKDGVAHREIVLDGGARAEVIEPRDYAVGRIVIEGTRGRITDRLAPGEKGLELVPLLEKDACGGFRAGEIAEHLAPEEAELARGDPTTACVTARMESMKRVGFRRLLLAIADGRGSYPIEDGLDDMAVDWFLERFGRWRRTPFTDVRRGLARSIWGAAGRLA